MSDNLVLYIKIKPSCARTVYRSRPHGKLDDDVLKFLSSIEVDSSILTYDIIGSQAHCLMLYDIGVLDSSELKKILRALEAAKKDPSVIDGDGFEDIHESLEAYVIKHAGVEAGGKMHTARSRNDQVVLDIRMKVRDDINQICSAIIDLIDELIKRADQNKNAIVPLYTHLQQAQLGTFSHVLLSYVDALFRDMERQYVAYGRINQSPLGAVAIGGTSINIDRKKTAVLLGFDGVIRNSIDATTSRDAFLEYVADISILAVTLARMAEDFILWSTSEFGYVELADELSSTSSAMPQKKNPDPLELVRSKSALISGHLLSMLALVKGLPSGYSRDLQDLKYALFSSSSMILGTLKIMKKVIYSTKINGEKMLEASRKSYAVSIDIAEQLVVRKKIPFRQAHAIVGALVAKAISRGNFPLSKLDIRDVEASLKEAKIDKALLTGAEVFNILKEMTPEKSVESRISSGSPQPDEQEEMIRLSRRKLEAYLEGVRKRTRYVAVAFENVNKNVKHHLDQ